MPNKFTQTYLATFNKKANAKRKVDVSGYSPDVQMSDSVPGLMGRGGEGDVLTNKPLSLQPSFVSGTEIHPDGLNRPPTVYYPSKMSEAGAFDQMMPRDFTRYGNYPEGAEIIRPRKTAPATRPGSPQTVISPGIGGNFSYGNTPPAPAPQLRATPPGLRPGPSALGKKAEDAISDPPFMYYPDAQMNDSVPGWMGRGGDADVLTPKPLGLQAPFASYPNRSGFSPATLYVPSNHIDEDGEHYINAPGKIDHTTGSDEELALRPGPPRTARYGEIHGIKPSLGNIPPDPAPQLRATPPGLRPGPSALGKKAEVSDIVAQTHSQSGFKGDPLAPTPTPAPAGKVVRAPFFQAAQAQQEAIDNASLRQAFTGVPNFEPISGPAPTPTILEMLMKKKLLAGAGLAAAGAAGYMGYKALSKKKKKKDDDDDDDKTASFTEAYYNGRKGTQSYADTYLTAFNKRALDEPNLGADFGKGGHTRLSADFGANEAPLTRRQREDGERESLYEEDRRNRAAGLPLRPNPNQAPRSWNPINIAADTAMNRADFADRTNAAGPVGNLASMSAEERGLVGNKINSMARSAGNQIKSMARSAGSAVNRVSDAYGRANEFMGDKLAPVVYPKVYEEAAGVDRNIPILMQHSRFAKALAPFDSKAPPKPGRQLSNISRLGTPEFSRTKLNPPPDLTGVVNSAAQNMNPNIKFK